MHETCLLGNSKRNKSKKGGMITLRITLFSLGFSLLFIIAYLLMSNRKETRKTTLARTFAKAGAPDQMDEIELADLENNKMVSEGSQFGVQYYNKLMHE